MSTEQDILLQDNLASNPENRGWQYFGNGEGDGANTGDKTADYAAAITAASGYWESPAFPVQPFSYYTCRFMAKAATNAYVSAMFNDHRGERLVADHYAGVDASTTWQASEFCFRAKADAVTAVIRFSPLDGGMLAVQQVEVKPLTAEKVLAWSESIYQQLSPLRKMPYRTSDDHLTSTLSILPKGPKLRIVMLGDSIINDVGSSPFDLMIEQSYPCCRIEVVTSVGGSKGCWYYRDENRLKNAVLKYDPDLVVLGGISERGDVASIEAVITQIRASCTADILCLTDVLGPPELHFAECHQEAQLPEKDNQRYRQELRALASRAGVAFFDIETVWREYFTDNQQPYAYFMRDRVHANERARQVIARILAGYFVLI